MKSTSLESKLYWIFRISAGLCFIGHGAFGIITKAEWLPYFDLVNIGPDIAYKLMPLVGFMDIALGISILLYPTRFVLIWMAAWCLWTAMLRPLVNQGWWEFFERAGNYGIPIAFLIMNRFIKDPDRSWFKSLTRKLEIPKVLAALDLKRVEWTLRIMGGLLLIGHGGFSAFMQKPVLLKHFAAAGLYLTQTQQILVGWFEILMGLFVIFRPMRPVLLFVVGWKLSTELLYPLSGTPIWEFIERWGSYGVPLALFFIVQHKVVQQAQLPQMRDVDYPQPNESTTGHLHA